MGLKSLQIIPFWPMEGQFAHALAHARALGGALAPTCALAHARVLGPLSWTQVGADARGVTGAATAKGARGGGCCSALLTYLDHVRAVVEVGVLEVVPGPLESIPGQRGGGALAPADALCSATAPGDFCTFLRISL